MDLTISEEEQEFVDAVRAFVSKEFPATQIGGHLNRSTACISRIRQLAGEMGIFSLGLPSEAGGSGVSSIEESLVFRELGRSLAPVGFLGSLLAARLANHTGAMDLRDSITSGLVPIAIGVAQGATSFEPEIPGSIYALDLSPGAHLLIVSPQGQMALVADDKFGDHEQISCLDPSTELTLIRAKEGNPEVSDLRIEASHLSLLGSLLVTAMLVGIAEATLDQSVEYAKKRIQFGRPIGSHQAVKHRCANMAVSCTAARSLMCFAAVAVRDGRHDASFQVRSARIIGVRAALENAQSNIQIHGGIGYTWDNPAHIYLSRVHLLRNLFGSISDQRENLISLDAPIS